jgi:hypothetical protein
MKGLDVWFAENGGLCIAVEDARMVETVAWMFYVLDGFAWLGTLGEGP